MSHIHTQPGQHDMTVSAFIVRQVDGEWKCLVHLHKKAGKLMQVGGHVELGVNLQIRTAPLICSLFLENSVPMSFGDSG